MPRVTCLVTRGQNQWYSILLQLCLCKCYSFNNRLLSVSNADWELWFCLKYPLIALPHLCDLVKLFSLDESVNIKASYCLSLNCDFYNKYIGAPICCYHSSFSHCFFHKSPSSLFIIRLSVFCHLFPGCSAESQWQIDHMWRISYYWFLLKKLNIIAACQRC